MKTHIVIDGAVTNTIVATVAEAQAAYPQAICIDGNTGGIGWTWDGVNLTAPDEPPSAAATPQSVTPRQARLALLQAGLLDDIEAAIEAIADVDTRRVAQIEWQTAQQIERDWPLLVQVAAAAGLTPEQIDELFVTAAGL